MINEFRTFLRRFLSIRDISNDTHVRKLFQNIEILFKQYGMLNSIINGRPVDAEHSCIPWYTYSAINYLKQLDFSRCSILEFGSGYSTIFWAKVARDVISIERDKSWFTEVSGMIESENVELLLFSERVSYHKFISSVSEKKYDVVIIDGRDRYLTMTHMLKAIKKGGILIFDNSDWYPQSCLYLRNKKYSQIDFCDFGPINNYTWSTSIFFKSLIEIPHNEGVKFPGRRDVIKSDDSIL